MAGTLHSLVVEKQLVCELDGPLRPVKESNFPTFLHWPQKAGELTDKLRPYHEEVQRTSYQNGSPTQSWGGALGDALASKRHRYEGDCRSPALLSSLVSNIACTSCHPYTAPNLSEAKATSLWGNQMH